MRGLVLDRISLASVPAQHLASLAACVTWNVYIGDVHQDTDLSPVLDSLKCQGLTISGLTMDTKGGYWNRATPILLLV